MRALGKHKIFAAALGVVFAVAPVYWFTSWLEGQGEAEASVAANWSIGFIDVTIDGVVARLSELAKRGVDACTPANVETLRQVGIRIRTDQGTGPGRAERPNVVHAT